MVYEIVVDQQTVGVDYGYIKLIRTTVGADLSALAEWSTVRIQ
jgi:hypothetical protein